MAHNPIEDEEFWRSQINSFQLELSEKGLKAPDIEKIDDGGYDLDMEGMLSEMRVNIYFFVAPDKNKYYMVNRDQRILDHGQMPFGEALKQISRRRRRR